MGTWQAYISLQRDCVPDGFCLEGLNAVSIGCLCVFSLAKAGQVPLMRTMENLGIFRQIQLTAMFFGCSTGVAL